MPDVAAAGLQIGRRAKARGRVGFASASATSIHADAPSRSRRLRAAFAMTTLPFLSNASSASRTTGTASPPRPSISTLRQSEQPERTSTAHSLGA